MFHDLKPYDAYDMTSSDSIPRFPSEWEVRPGAIVLSDVRERNDGLRENTILSLSYGRVVVKPSENVHGLVPASYETYQILQPGDIVFRPTDLQNDQSSLRVGQVRTRGIITAAYLGLRPKGIDPQYAFLYLKALDTAKVFYGMGSGLRQNIDFRDFKRLPVPVPSPREQEAIVTYLAHAHQRINSAIDAKRRLTLLLEEQKRATINRFVTSGLHTDASTRDTGVPWIGKVPIHWELLAARYLFRPVTRPVTNSNLPQLSLTRSIGLVQSGAEGSNTREAENGSNLQECAYGDFVLNKYRAHLGLFRWCRESGLVTRNYTVLEPTDRIDRDYFEYLFLDPVFADGLRINARGVGDGMSPLYTSTLMAMKMPVPPRPEQQAIVEAINAETARIDTQLQLTAREIELLVEFRDRLTVDVVTGQFDVREAAVALPPPDLQNLVGNAVASIGVDEMGLDDGLEAE